MAIIFDGNAVAKEKKKDLKKKIDKLGKRAIVPTMVSIMIGDNKASRKYLSMKKALASSVGADLRIHKIEKNVAGEEIISLIEKLNGDPKVHGIMVQLPLPPNFSDKDKENTINAIEKPKDIDGMRDDSMYVAPVVKSILKALGEAYKHTIYSRGAKTVVVGAKGFVGKKILRVLEEMGYEVKGVDVDTKKLSDITLKANILISVTGVSGLIKGNMVKKGALVIDVGSPDGDVATEEILEKVKFISPVPGGVGPLTIAYLLENLVDAASS
jgi:methylenetetrahydrofolate dehydrogenase (NADP+)/methenyltetrahydrofolate cyclohydrolase